MNRTFHDPDAREAILYEIADLRKRRAKFRRVAAVTANDSWAASLKATAQANETDHALRVVWRIYENLAAIERRRSEDYLRTCWAETVTR